MTSADLLADLFKRVRDIVHRVVDGLTPDDLTVRLDSEANSIGWLMWHLTRIQDDHVAGVAATEQVWASSGWATRFDCRSVSRHRLRPHPPTGCGCHQHRQHAARVLRGCPRDDAPVRAATDRNRPRSGRGRAVDPPVTLGARLVSVVADDLQHAGQAAYIRGILERR